MSKKPQERAAEMPDKEGAARKDWLTFIKGMVALMLTALLVIIVTMLFAKSLFVSNASDEKITGRLTAPPNVTTIMMTTTSATTTKATTTRDANYDPYEEKKQNQQEELLASGATHMKVKSAVYLRSAPNSTSESKIYTTIPAAAEVTAFSITNYNWIYVEYNGIKGYAYGDFFEGDRPTAVS
ncbi:MAG: SH3 domain-containing protein [Ruminococcus sp.]|nr:SH3 domain-containing protein [Ruminococcus sp.]